MTSASRVLPFADAAAIVRANQKDSYIEQILIQKLSNFLQIKWGQRITNSYPEEVSLAAKILYLVATTLLGARTLGEEYVDVLYVTRDGLKLPRAGRRLAFISSYTLLPYLATRLVRRIQRTRPEWSNFVQRWSSYASTAKTIHTALFYFNGQFYSMAKRIWGLRYASGRAKRKAQQFNYSLLGVLILLRYAAQAALELAASPINSKQVEKHHQLPNIFSSIDDLKQIEGREHDLSDPSWLEYITERSCMLCLSPMTCPSAAMCGHIFCWSCILEWLRDRPECPLCRQRSLPQHVLPLR